MTLLSKSKYLAGCQCPRRLWLGSFAPELAAARDWAGEARLVLGAEIGRHAYALFPGGVLVDEEAWRHGEAIARTSALVADPPCRRSSRRRSCIAASACTSMSSSACRMVRGASAW